MSGMNFREAAMLPILRYADFTGRSNRQEFWSYMAVRFLIFVSWSILQDVLIDPAVEMEGGALPMALYGAIIAWWILTGLPTLALQVRRLHDQDLRGWWWFVIVFPTLGLLLFLFWMIRSGTIGHNRFGPDTVAR
jgi:uncharacterized membrane protein YhaH (DUF805 family)